MKPATLREALQQLTYANDDGSEYEHNEGCEGETECAACWAQDIRKALAEHPDQVAVVQSCVDMEDYARIHNQGWDAAVEQFAEVFTEIRSNLADGAAAIDVLGELDDLVNAMTNRDTTDRLDGGPYRWPIDVARNIVNQLGDLWKVPVDVRQVTNDHADRFIAGLVVRVPTPIDQLKQIRDASITAAEQGAVDRCIDALGGRS